MFFSLKKKKLKSLTSRIETLVLFYVPSVRNWDCSTHCCADALANNPTWSGLRMCTRQVVISTVRQDQMNDTEGRADAANKINYHFPWPTALLIPSYIKSLLYL